MLGTRRHIPLPCVCVGLNEPLRRGGAGDRRPGWLLQRRRGILTRCILLGWGIVLLLGRWGLLKWRRRWGI